MTPPAGGTAELLRRLVRYSGVTVVGLGISQLVLVATLGLWAWPALWSNLLACAAATWPTFHLNRRWVWRRDGSADFSTEVVPFWALNLVGLGVSTAAAVLAEAAAPARHPHALLRFLVIDGAAVGSLALLWVTKFWLLERVLFGETRRASTVVAR